MSKSDPNTKATIFMSDTSEEIRAKISKAVTDDDPQIAYDPQNRPGIANLLNIWASVSDCHQPEDLAAQCTGGKALKDRVSNIVVDLVTSFQEEHNGLSDQYVERVLSEGAEAARKCADRNLKIIEGAIGIGI